MIHRFPFLTNKYEKYSLSWYFLPERISSLIKTSFKPSKRKKQKSIGPVISHRMPESVISIRRNRSSVYNLAINDPITVTLRGGSVPTVATFSFLFVPKVFPTSYNHFSRNVPPVSNPPPTRSSSPSPLHESGLVSHRFLGNPPPPPPYNRLSQRNSFRGFFPGLVHSRSLPPVERGTGSLAQKNFNSSPTTEKVSDDFLFPRIFTSIRTSKDSRCCLCPLKILGLAFALLFFRWNDKPTCA